MLAINKVNNNRVKIVYIGILSLFLIFVIRLFMLQIIKHDEYQSQALETQLKKFVIPAQRGEIYLQDNSGYTPLVLNETKHLLWVDPQFINNVDYLVSQVNPIIKRNARDLNDQISQSKERYLKIADEINLEDAQKIKDLDLAGLGLVEYSSRVYPEDSLASHVLGFVNADGDGQYGLEQHYDQLIGGKDGQFKAVTDTNGVPLRASDDNVLDDPVNGSRINLSLERTLQSTVEDIIESNTLELGAKSASAIIMNPDTGEVVAMANYPAFNPKDYVKIANDGQERVFNNIAVDTPYETGSVVKIFTMATALNNGVVRPSDTWYDAARVTIDDYDIENVEGGAGVKTIKSIITESLNTGTVHLLGELGEGSINGTAKNVLHDSFVNNFGYGQLTGIELANEQIGVVPEADNVSDITYANMTFGQGMTNTMIQIASGFGGLINGGTQFQPTIIESIIDEDGNSLNTEPRVLRENTVTPEVSKQLRDMLISVVEQDYLKNQLTRKGYEIGGKTGTAQVPLSDGTYSDTLEIGSFVGYIDNNQGDRYVVMTRIDQPQIAGYAGGGAAAPMFGEIAQYLIDYYGISPNKELLQ